MSKLWEEFKTDGDRRKRAAVTIGVLTVIFLCVGALARMAYHIITLAR